MFTAPATQPSVPRPRRAGIAVGTITALIVAGLVTVPATAAVAADPLPEDAVAFLVSQTDAAASTAPSLTPDGQRVAFTSTASDLVAGDTNGSADIFLSAVAEGTDDPFAGAATLISTPDASMPRVPANGPSSQPVASADGRYVAFLSAATNLVPGDNSGNGWVNVYVRDTVLGTTIRLDGADGEPLGDARSVDMSDDGRFVVFVSEADNLSSGDENETWDGFIADLDTLGDGVLGDVTITRVMPDRSIPYGLTELVISGNGERIAFHTIVHPDGSDPEDFSDFVFQGLRSNAGVTATLLARGAHDIAIDSAGSTMTYVSDIACGSTPTVIAATVDIGGVYWVAVGVWMVERRSGTVAAPRISADASTVAWESTQPPFSFSGQAPALPQPVVRVGAPSWTAATTGGQCSPIEDGWEDIAPGVDIGLSASGRTVAYSGVTDAAPGATAAIVAVDRHTHEGLSVSSVQGESLIPSYMTIVDISRLSVASVRGYASALANAPIHRLPIHRLPIHRLPIHRLPIHRLLIDDSPIHRLPIHRLPIHRLPIHRLDIPGGWAELLAPTPFGSALLQSVTLAEVLEWADTTLADDSSTPAARDAATRIQSLSLDDVDLDGSGIDGLSLASLLIGGAALAQVQIPGEESPTSRWQAVVEAQALGVTIDDTTLLADLDAAGLDIDRSGIESVPLSTLPIADTLLDTVDMNSLFLTGTPLGDLDLATLTPETQTTLLGGAASGRLADYERRFLSTATVADLAGGAPADLTFGTLLFSLLDAESFPWEDIAPSSIYPTASLEGTPGFGCNGKIRCETLVQFSYTFDPGPGEDALYPAPIATATLPVGTVLGISGVQAAGSGPLDTWRDLPYTGAVQEDGRRVAIALADMPGGTTISLDFWYSRTNAPGPTESRATLTSRGLAASALLRANSDLIDYDDPANNRVNGDWDDPARAREALQEGRLYYEWISPVSTHSGQTPGSALDEDYFLVNPPAPGQRLVISTNAADGQIALALFSQTTPGSPLGVAAAGATPGTPVTEQSTGAAGSAEAGGDAAPPLAGHTLVDQATVGGDGVAEIHAASADTAAGAQMLLRVTSGNGLSSSSLYSLRARYVDEAPDAVCAAWAPAQTADPGVIGSSDDVTGSTNTVYLFDERRFGDTHGAAEAARVRAALATLTGTGSVGGSAVDGAVLSVDADAAVRGARAALDANPCSMSARRALTGAINAYVSAELGSDRDHIASIVLVGGDDILPLAPVAQHTALFNEAGHAADLRRPAALDGSACPATVAEGAVDACATPLSAAAAANYILTDDPYGLADAYRSAGGNLYVPTVGVGRLVETPAQIIDAVARFVDADGVLAADSTLAAGYGAWSELPALVTENLRWRAAAAPAFPSVWDKSVLEDRLFGQQSARIVSINTHADETRMIPGIPNAEDGNAAANDLFAADGHVFVPSETGGSGTLDGALVFMIGCHAGGNLPTAYYGDVPDWADVFSSAGGFVGNTGFGLANSVSTALSERLLGMYADWVGVTTNGSVVSAADALTYAKQSYLGGLGLYSGYDEKVLMEAVYYGLPMYTFSATATPKPAPLPQRPDDLTPVQDVGGLLAASLSLTPAFQTVTKTDDAGRSVSYLTADAQDPLVVPGQPILPRVAQALDPAPEGLVARGALITGLASERVEGGAGLAPAIAAPTIGVPETTADRGGVAFPSTFATLTTQQTPNGRVDLLVTTPGRVEAAVDGSGTLERFTSMAIDVVYAAAGNADTTAPIVKSVTPPAQNNRTFRVVADGTTSGVSKVLLLAQPEGEAEWRQYWLSLQAEDLDGDGRVDSHWVGDVGFGGAFRWIVQVVDEGGNVATESARGHLDPAAAAAPQLSGELSSATLVAGERLTRTVDIDDAAVGERLSASFRITSATGDAVGSGSATVEVDQAGAGHATVDRIMDAPGAYTITLSVCRGASCSALAFEVTVTAPNTAPSASVTLSSSPAEVWPTSTLTAVATASDPDQGDTPTLTYQWFRNGVGVPGSEPTLSLAAIAAAAGDVISVVVTPHDGRTSGHAARAEVLVKAQPVPPALPVITATASAGAAPYAEGSWSRSPVTVSFTCTSGSPVLACPAPQTVSADTTPAGVTVSGTMQDLLGRTANASVLVRVDRTAPTLAPAVTPATVRVGAPAVAAANATDAASGIASQSCATPDTTTAGTKTVTCSATDVAGNTATASAGYVVTPTAPAMCAGVLDRTALAPLNADGSSVFLRTSGVPVVFRACDAQGKAISTKKFVKSVTLVSSTALPASAKVNELWYLPLGEFGFQSISRTWVGVIDTAKLAKGKKYTYKVLLADGSSFTLAFGIR